MSDQDDLLPLPEDNIGYAIRALSLAVMFLH